MMDKYSTKGVTIIMGDFNARIRSITFEDILGPWHLRGVDGEQNDAESNATLLMEFCRARDVVIPASWMRRSQDKMVTYRAPGTNQPPGPEPDPHVFAELDLVLTPR
eukprot:3672413-Alexandrium_andersonii.AAC.1